MRSLITKPLKLRFGRLGNIKIAGLLLLLLSTGVFESKAQQTITVFDGVLFYGGYAPLFTEEQLYEPIPAEVIRHSNSKYGRKLTDTELDAMGNTLDISVVIEAACDNYDRAGHVYIVFAPKNQVSYVPDDVERIEIARFITPFMNKNYSPNTLSFNYTANNVAEIFTNPTIRAEYDIWVELDIFGTTGAGETQVAGCAGRKDTFRGTLTFTSTQDTSIVYNDEMVYIPLVARENLNNYNATDVPGETTKIINFELDQQVEDLKLYLITSNHGANSGGEEYVRRRHDVYLNDNLIYQYTPGGKSCEPYRVFNTQGNGIYGPSTVPLRGWIYWNNWCPGDVIPTHEVSLGTLPAGEYTLKIDIPDAEFVDNQGQIPLSAYLQNRNSGNTPTCVMPVALSADALSGDQIMVNWEEMGTAEEWEILYGKIYNSNGQTTYAVLAEENYAQVTSGVSEEIIQDNINPETVYQLFVRSKCDDNVNSMWSEPRYVQTLTLSVEDHKEDVFSYYPNPVQENLFIHSEGSVIDEIIIYNIQGKEVMRKKIGSIDYLVNMQSITSGTYLLKVKFFDSVKTYKIQKK